MTSVSDLLLELVAARRLMLEMDRVNSRRKHQRGHPGETRAAESLVGDRLALSGGVGAVASPPERAGQPNDIRIRLSDLMTRLRDLNTTPASASPPQTIATEVAVAAQTETTVHVEYRTLEPVQGLVLRDQHLAETDRYAFEFQDGATFRIIDKWSGKSTTIWGDPHVDTSDEEGDGNGEFDDLTASDRYTTLELQDGTRVTFTAPDSGVIEAVDIFKGTQHVHGIGSGSKEWSDTSCLFARSADDALTAASALPLGDVVHAGGDGNDWFDALGRLVWGRTTGLAPATRPAFTLETTIAQQERLTISRTIDRIA